VPNWRIKSAIHRAISGLPKPHLWNEVFQRLVTKSLELPPQEFTRKVGQSQTHVGHLLDLRSACAGGFTVFEVGTGWYPVMPVGFYLCGAAEVWTFDIEPFLRRARLKQMLRYFSEFHERGELQKLLPLARPERVERLREALAYVDGESPYQVLERLHIHARTGDAQQTGLPPNSIDLFTSTSVLEYIPRPVLKDILAEFHRVASANPVMSHFINLLDEYCHFDRSITPFNFLKYSDRQWKYLDSPLIRKNRLRICDYRELFRQAGYTIVKENNTHGNPEDLKKIQLAPEFQNYTREDLLVLTSWLVAKPA